MTVLRSNVGFLAGQSGFAPSITDFNPPPSYSSAFTTAEQEALRTISSSEVNSDVENYITEGIYPISGNTPSHVTSNITVTYADDLWSMMMRYYFPGTGLTEFNANPTYYKNLFTPLVHDFYASFFLGRDDLNVKTDNPIVYDTSVWTSLTTLERETILYNYLSTRENQYDPTLPGALYLKNMNQRANSILYWISALVVETISGLQSSTINTAQLTNRYSQLQQSVAQKVLSSGFSYKLMSSGKDFSTQNINSMNTKTLEVLRSYRNIFQKHGDDSSNQLQSNNNAIETQSQVALEFIDKAQKITKKIFM